MQQKDKNCKRRNILRRIISVIQLAILAFLVLGIPLYVYFYHRELIDNFRNLDAINAFLHQYQTASIFAYIGLQIMQIIISVLPGQALQFAAGYAYAFWLGYLYSIIGVALGTTITFYLAKLLGKNAICVIFGEEKLNEFVELLNSKRAYTIMFVIFLIPGIPKDILTYAAGISATRLKPFLLLSLVGRTPAMMGSIMMGSMFNKGSYTGLIILASIAVIACIIGILKRKKILEWTDKAYYRIIR